jgi:hypothetical protein
MLFPELSTKDKETADNLKITRYPLTKVRNLTLGTSEKSN